MAKEFMNYSGVPEEVSVRKMLANPLASMDAYRITNVPSRGAYGGTEIKVTMFIANGPNGEPLRLPEWAIAGVVVTRDHGQEMRRIMCADETGVRFIDDRETEVSPEAFHMQRWLPVLRPRPTRAEVVE